MTLKDALNNPKVSRNEVSLFGAMIDYFRRSYASVVIDQTHKHIVSYNAIAPYQNWGKVDKEISDVFFLVFSRSREIARMTHLQAKWRKAPFDRKTTPQFKFHLDAGQYHMLSNRLSIKDPQNIYPWDILSYPLYSDSIASYGVFYQNSSNQIEMGFEIASMLSCAARKPFKGYDDKPKYQFATLDTSYGYVNKNLAQLEKYGPRPYYDWICRYYCPYHYRVHYELLSTLDTYTFETELLDLHVGTRVDFHIKHLTSLANYFQKHKDVNGTIQNFLEFTDYAIDRNRLDGDIILENMDRIFDNYPPDIKPDVQNNGDGILVLIDADETVLENKIK